MFSRNIGQYSLSNLEVGVNNVLVPVENRFKVRKGDILFYDHTVAAVIPYNIKSYDGGGIAFEASSFEVNRIYSDFYSIETREYALEAYILSIPSKAMHMRSICQHHHLRVVNTLTRVQMYVYVSIVSTSMYVCLLINSLFFINMCIL